MLGAVLNFADITAVHALQEQQKALLQMVSHDLARPADGHQGARASRRLDVRGKGSMG